MDTKAFDFAALDLAEAADKPFEFEIKHPESGDGLGVFVSVVGAESATFQAYIRAEGNKARRRQFEQQRKGREEPMTLEEEEETILRALAACMTGWRSVIDGQDEPVIMWGGNRLQFSTDAAIKWLKQFRWVREQVNKATADIANFIAP